MQVVGEIEDEQREVKLDTDAPIGSRAEAAGPSTAARFRERQRKSIEPLGATTLRINLPKSLVTKNTRRKNVSYLVRSGA